MVDALWDIKLKPAILARYPNTTAAQLTEAHGYAYGGAIIQDMGYYPYGSEFFSDLLHYVRSGEFVSSLIQESQTVDEYAFALGAVSHYVGDNDGHQFAVNPGEPMLYPKLREKFGPVITYEDNPTGHLRTEFGFDVLEVAKGNFAPEAYHDFIGFEVAVPVLARAFHDTYSLELGDVFSNFEKAVGSYRYAVSKTIPMATRVAWADKSEEIKKSIPGETRIKFQYIMKRSSYEQEWGKTYDKPSLADRILAGLLKLLPPVGPLRALKLTVPTPTVEQLFMKSFERATVQFAVPRGPISLQNTNLDTGLPEKPGTYRLNDEAHAKLLDELAKKDFAGLTDSTKQELAEFYGNLSAPDCNEKRR